MIKYALKCNHGHTFDSWFGSSADFDRLKGANLVTCAVCGSTEVEKTMMAPRVQTSDQPETLRAPASPAEQALQALRDKIETEFDDVGGEFAAEVRRISDGEAPERGIYGQARLQDARALLEEGHPIAPLPFSNKPKN
ncbi:MAG: DUF1178 family protein [Pseudomonadota bacterium]